MTLGIYFYEFYLFIILKKNDYPKSTEKEDDERMINKLYNRKQSRIGGPRKNFKIKYECLLPLKKA